MTAAGDAGRLVAEGRELHKPCGPCHPLNHAGPWCHACGVPAPCLPAMLAAALENSEAKTRRILDAYHMSYRHGPDPEPKTCPACHAAALESL